MEYPPNNSECCAPIYLEKMMKALSISKNNSKKDTFIKAGNVANLKISEKIDKDLLNFQEILMENREQQKKIAGTNKTKTLEANDYFSQYQQQLYFKIESSMSYQTIVDNGYDLPPDQLFSVPDQWSSTQNLEKYFEELKQRNNKLKINLDCKYERTLLLHNLPELLKTERNFNLKLGQIFHEWIKPLAHLSLIKSGSENSKESKRHENLHNIPDVFNTIFVGFPKLYFRQIDRWRNLISDLENQANDYFSIKGFCQSFLCQSYGQFENDMAGYIYHCKLMQQDNFKQNMMELKLVWGVWDLGFRIHDL